MPEASRCWSRPDISRAKHPFYVGRPPPPSALAQFLNSDMREGRRSSNACTIIHGGQRLLPPIPRAHDRDRLFHEQVCPDSVVVPGDRTVMRDLVQLSPLIVDRGGSLGAED